MFLESYLHATVVKDYDTIQNSSHTLLCLIFLDLRLLWVSLLLPYSWLPLHLLPACGFIIPGRQSPSKENVWYSGSCTFPSVYFITPLISLDPRVDGNWSNREDSGKGEPCSGVWERERVVSLLRPRETPLQRKVCLFLAGYWLPWFLLGCCPQEFQLLKMLAKWIPAPKRTEIAPAKFDPPIRDKRLLLAGATKIKAWTVALEWANHSPLNSCHSIYHIVINDWKDQSGLGRYTSKLYKGLGVLPILMQTTWAWWCICEQSQCWGGGQETDGLTSQLVYPNWWSPAQYELLCQNWGALFLRMTSELSSGHSMCTHIQLHTHAEHGVPYSHS